MTNGVSFLGIVVPEEKQMKETQFKDSNQVIKSLGKSIKILH